MAITPIATYAQHPLAIKLMPMGMDTEEFRSFSEDIRDRGVIVPITLYEGKVLDGWHRYKASLEHGVACPSVTYEGNAPIEHIVSINVQRRRLTSLQRSLVAARLHLDHGLTQRAACKKLGVSNEVVSMVIKVLQANMTPLISKIENDPDFTRGVLREELWDRGMLSGRYAPINTCPAADTLTVNSVFSLGSVTTAPEDTPTIDCNAAPASPQDKEQAMAVVHRKVSMTHSLKLRRIENSVKRVLCNLGTDERQEAANTLINIIQTYLTDKP